MYARITAYQLKPGTRDAAVAKLEALKSEIMSLPGTLRFLNTVDDNGRGYVVSVNESKETSDAISGQVQAIWANFAEFLAAAPSPEGYDVIADWSN